MSNYTKIELGDVKEKKKSQHISEHQLELSEIETHLNTNFKNGIIVIIMYTYFV